jgi:hypothetical protein
MRFSSSLGIGLASVAAWGCGADATDGSISSLDGVAAPEVSEVRQEVATGAAQANFREHSVGVWPNYYFDGRPQPLFGSATAKSAARAADLGHSMLWVDWHEHWYADGCVPAGPCALRDSDADGDSDLFEYLDGYLKVWAARNALALDVNLIVQVHTHGFGVSAAGPAWLHLSPEGILPANDPRVLDAFIQFYAELYAVMNKGNYRNKAGRAQWLVSLGNEVDVYLPDPDAWLRYIDFYGRLTANGVNGNPKKVPITFTASTTYLGGVHFARPFAQQLFRLTPFISLTHYPIWSEPENLARHLHPVHHSVVIQDFQFISAFTDEVSALRGAPSRVFLQEVGYPTGNGCPVFPPGHPQVGEVLTPCDPQVEQKNYVDAVFANWEVLAGKIAGITWWSLFDYSVDECTFVWGSTASPWCTMGLYDANRAAKPAWQAFSTAAADVCSW